MKSPNYKVKIGIVGCGAIGSRMAKAIVKDLRKDCKISGLYDIDILKARTLAKRLKLKGVVNNSIHTLIQNCDCMVEAVSADNTKSIIRQGLMAKKSVLAMSVGKILNSAELFKIAKKNKCYLLLPSGALAGLDAVKAASLAFIKKITLTSRKPLAGFRNNPYFAKKGINLATIKKETILFKGSVDKAVQLFPQNINVAATLALASGVKKKITVKIVTSPLYKRNCHEMEILGDFGKITTKTDNEVCPDNPKSSYLAVLSGLQTLKQYCTGILIGT